MTNNDQPLIDDLIKANEKIKQMQSLLDDAAFTNSIFLGFIPEQFKDSVEGVVKVKSMILLIKIALGKPSMSDEEAMDYIDKQGVKKIRTLIEDMQIRLMEKSLRIKGIKI